MGTIEEILHATFSTEQRKELAKSGAAMVDGSYPIRNASDLQNAIQAVGRASGGEEGRNAVRRHIIKRAKALGLSDKIPDTWKADGTLEHTDVDGNLEHAVSGPNTAAAIMAIPAPLENIRLVGDEEKHATLLFFGETSTLPDDAKNTLVDSVKMACSMLFPFSESIRQIGRLGDDTPPALVAELTASDLRQVRDLFKMNPSVNGYLDNAHQYPSFTPHVTLGYPDYVEEVILRTLAAQLHRVRFDRLAVWWNDERIEFPLSQKVEEDSMEMSEAVGAFLEHFGTKGMKWGVRKAKDGASTNSGATKLSDEAVNAHNAITSGYSKRIHSAKNESEMEDLFDEAYKAGHVEGNLKVNSTEPSRDLKKIRYEVKLFSLTPDAENTHSGDGVKTEYIVKTVDRRKPGEGRSHADDEADRRKEFDEHLFNLGLYTEAMDHSAVEKALEHAGVKGMKWGVRKDERALSPKDQALNFSQRSQVKVASAISAVSTAGITSNAGATLFQLQARWERLKVVQAIIDQAENNPLLDDAGREALRRTKSQAIKGIVSSAIATTVISAAVGIAANRTARAYFAPLHKVYGDQKPKINAEIKRLGKDLKSGKRPKMTSREYHAEVSKIVEKHMMKDLSNALSPFHELARSQLGTEYGTKKLDISFSKLPNTPLVEKMTIVTPTGIKLVKAVKTVQHADDDVQAPDLELFFDYKFDEEGFIEEWYSPTIEVAADLFENKFNIQELMHAEGGEIVLDEADKVDAALEHAGVKGMKWGVRRRVDPETGLVARTDSADQIHVDRITKKLATGGVSALSNKDLQDYSTRINRQQEFNRALSSQEAQKSKPFIQRFFATQGKKQLTRVIDKAIDVAVEKALEEAGIRIGKKGGNPDAADLLVKTSKRLQPKKK